MKPFATEAEKQERREMIGLLRGTPPEQLAADGERATIEAFQRTLRSVPAYRKMVAETAGGVPQAVGDLDAFKRHAPLLDKHNTFAARNVRELCVGGTIEGVRSILTSSGHSGVFSFGVNTAENLARSAQSIDMGLQYIFGIDEHSTLLINALPMGVKVHTRGTVLAETSVRDDMVYALVKQFAAEFDQIAIVGEASFLKKIIEDGAELHGIDWPRLRVNLITGEEGIAENYRDYIGRLIGIADPSRPGEKYIISSMGVAELDLNIFHETLDTIVIRRLAHRDPALRRALFGSAARVCPMLFAYYPHRCFVETLADDEEPSELVISMLSEQMKIPLLRYRSGDIGRVFRYGEMVELLKSFGHAIAPDLKLPFVAVYGRGHRVAVGAGSLFPEEVKEAIYADHAIAAALTGNFRIAKTAGDGVDIALQLRKDKRPPADAAEQLSIHLAAYNPLKPAIRFISYGEFPYAMEIDYERKFRYV